MPALLLAALLLVGCAGRGPAASSSAPVVSASVPDAVDSSVPVVSSSTPDATCSPAPADSSSSAPAASASVPDAVCSPAPSASTPASSQAPSASAPTSPGSSSAVSAPEEQPVQQADTDRYTTTRTTDYLVQLHLTTPEQAAAGRQGGEGRQIVFSMDAAPSDPQQLVLGTNTNGIWKSTDSGQSWRNITGGFASYFATEVAFSPADAQTLYAVGAVNDKLEAAVDWQQTASGLYRSTDGGETWDYLLSLTYTRFYHGSLIAFGQEEGGQTVYLGRQKLDGAVTQSGGLLKSVDGVTFAEVAFAGLPDGQTDPGTVYDICVSGQNIILATEEAGILYSADGGAGWTSRNNGLPGLFARSVTVNPVNPAHWFAIVDKTLYETLDAGESWAVSATIGAAEGDTFTGRGGLSDNPLEDPRHLSGSNPYFYRVAFSAAPESGPPYLFLAFGNTQNSLRVSDDYGAGWRLPAVESEGSFVGPGNRGYYSEAFALHPTDPDCLWAPFTNELYRSIDGGHSFVSSSGGLSGGCAGSILFEGGGAEEMLLGFWDFGLVRSSPAAQTGAYPVFENLLESVPYFDGSRNVFGLCRDPADASHLFALSGSRYSNVVLESFDGGSSWCAKTLAAGSDAWAETHSTGVMQYHREDADFIYAKSLYSADGGETWDYFRHEDSIINVCAVCPQNNDIIFGRDMTGAKGTVFVSADRGRSWARVRASIDGTSVSDQIGGLHRVMAAYQQENGDVVVWVGRYGSHPVKITLPGGDVQAEATGRVYGDEAGFARAAVGGKRARPAISCMAQNPNDPNHLVAGGVDAYTRQPLEVFYQSFDGGETWLPVEGMTGTQAVYLIAFHPDKPQVWLATTNGTWVYEYEKHPDAIAYAAGR